jgi:lipopolysaccharide export system protein LptA
MRINAYIRFFSPISSNRSASGLTQCFAVAALSLLPLNVQALPEDADQPIHIRADSAEFDQKADRVTYRGSVQVDQGTLRVTADTMTIDRENEKVVRITAIGTPAYYQQQVEVDQEQVRADASTIIYHTQDERIDLKGDANLEQEGSTVSGDLIVYDIVAGKVDATAEGDAPVRMVLQPAATASATDDASPTDDATDSEQ